MTTQATDDALIHELADVFDTKERVDSLLTLADLPRKRLPRYGSQTPVDYWRSVVRELDRGIVSDGRSKILSAALEEYPGNATFEAEIARRRSRPRKTDPDRARGVSVPLGLAQDFRTGDLFQDFSTVDLDENFNPVSRLWADAARANSISASVDLDESFLRVRFVNKAESFPSNLTIRPRNERALAHGFKNPLLTFEARIPRSAEGEPERLHKVAAGVRVINVWDQHWAYSNRSGEYHPFRIEGANWSRHSVKLMAQRWHLFTSDGHAHGGPSKPDFDVLCGVVLELGSYHPIRPGAGVGMVDIRQIRLQEDS